MIDTRNFEILESEGYSDKSEAYLVIEMRYYGMRGVTTYYDDGLYYIVQSKSMR